VVRVKVCDEVHELASVTVTVYVPATRLEILADVAPVFHLYEYGALPPVTDVNEIVPLEFVQIGFVVFPLMDKVEMKLVTTVVVEP